MTTQNPATPAQAATPGSGEQKVTTPSGAAPTSTPGQGNSNQEGTVTISVKDFAQLQRDAARGRSPKGNRVYQRPSANNAVNFDPNDPNASAIAEANRQREEAEKRALKLEVQGKVRDLLTDERFKSIPQSTKKLILDAPHALSNAETLEEAMYDIEDKLMELAGIDNIPVTVKTNDNPSNNQPTPNTPPARETPPVVTPGTPAPIDAATLEDTSNLRGSARSVATLRNAMKKQGIIKQP